MNIYKDTTRQKSFFYYYGWTIVVFFAMFFLIYFLIFQSMFYVKRTQKVEFFIAAYGLKDDSYHKTIEKQFKEDGLIEANFYSYIEDDKNLYNYFTANGENADFIIFSETNVKDLKDYLIYNYYDVSTLVESIPSISHFDTYKYEDDKSYGIKIYDGQNEEYNNRFTFSDLIKFDYEGKEKESYYLLIDNQSPNFDKEGNHTLGYSVLEYFLSTHEK